MMRDRSTAATVSWLIGGPLRPRSFAALPGLGLNDSPRFQLHPPNLCGPYPRHRTLAWLLDHDAAASAGARHCRRPDRVPADLLDRPPDLGRRAAWPAADRFPEELRDRDPARRHPRRGRALLAKLSQAELLDLKVIAGFIPTGIIGLGLYHVVKTYLLGNEMVVLGALAVGGLVLILFELWHREPPGAVGHVNSITYRQAVCIGLFQALAIVPGVSRSGATIVGGLAIGLKRETIVEYSFLLAVPTMLAATGLDLFKNASSCSPVGERRAGGWLHRLLHRGHGEHQVPARIRPDAHLHPLRHLPARGGGGLPALSNSRGGGERSPARGRGDCAAALDGLGGAGASGGSSSNAR